MLYEHLSHGVGFDWSETIAQRQLNTAVLAWLKGEEPRYNFNPERVTSRALNERADRVIISVRMTHPEWERGAIRTFRDEVHRMVEALFREDISVAPRRDFAHWLEREQCAGGAALFGAVEVYRRRVLEMAEIAGDFLATCSACRGEGSW